MERAVRPREISGLLQTALRGKVCDMDTNQVAEHLQIIRTLMERSALYRRALAPIMTYCGVLGLAGGAAGWLLHVNSDRAFVFYWSGVAMLALIGAFLLVRRQALKDAEPFWSPPTRRVAQALIPALFVGCFVSIGIVCMASHADNTEQIVFVIVWTWLYGCAIHSAGFFMARGIKLFGWMFILLGCGLFVFAWKPGTAAQAHFLMGGTFGGLHLAYGVYLYFTENQKTSL